MKVLAVLDVPHIIGGSVGRATPDVPHWVRSCDVDADGGRGRLEITSDPALALRFPDFVAAWDYWRRQSTVEPLRFDGKPNRPLTALSISIEDEP